MAIKSTEHVVLTVEEARKKLRLSRGLMYEALRRGDIPNIRIGRRILIPTDVLERLLERQHASNTSWEH